MAKNAPVKKSKRRLKRSVRRSLSAVLMITAIGVAAIPVPENYARNDDIMLLAQGDNADVHFGANGQLDGFGYNPVAASGSELGTDEDIRGVNNPTNTTFTLAKYEQEAESGDDSRFVNLLASGDVFASYSVLDISSESGGEFYNLGWQFMYYNVTNPRGGGTAGVICKYNTQYSSPTVDLPLNPITEYFLVTQEDINTYFSTDKGSQSFVPKGSTQLIKMDSKNPKEPEVYTYADYTFGVKNETYPFLYEYFNEELENRKSEWERYDELVKEAKESGEEYDPDGSKRPQNFSKAPSDLEDESLRRQYFAEHCTTLTGAGDYKLYPAQDGRPNSTGGTIYLAKGTLNEDSGYKEDKNHFLAVSIADYSMCGIGNKAFKGVSNVVSMSVPSQIGYIGNEAFMNASHVQSITLNNVSEIGNRAFMGCTSLTSIDLGPATEKIGAECFSNATALQSIQFGVNTRVIGYGAFNGCSSMTSIVFAEKGQRCQVKDYAFNECTALTSVSMENANITKLGVGAFAASSGAAAISFVLPKTLGAIANENTGDDRVKAEEAIGDFLFAGRASLQHVVFPSEYGRTKNVTIPPAIFHGCLYLEYLEFPCDPKTDPNACAYVDYDPNKLFADVRNPDLYVKGPKTYDGVNAAYPRSSTWDAVTAVSSTVPYLYIEDGVEYYEVSDGFYLICINNQGIMTSCTFKSQDPSDWEKWLEEPDWRYGESGKGEDGSIYKNWGGESGRLVIPALVGDTKVVGIASGCFSDSNLNSRVLELVIEDNSISSIADGVFQGGGGRNGNDWLKLKKVYIGNSVNSIGNNAFKDCSSLIDVTFSSPLGGHEAFTIGTDAFKTQSPQLTFHGDIVEGYAPFEWATAADNIIQDQDAIRVCYRSLSPTYLTVMYNPITDMVTLLDYPKYNEISKILNEVHAEEFEGRYSSYEDMKVAEWYERYAGPEYDDARLNFVKAWLSAADDLNAEAKKSELYADTLLYGPWINPDVRNDWETWKARAAGTVSGAPEEEEDVSGNALIDWLFEPITAYAFEDAPSPYYEIYKYDVAEIVDANDPYRAPTAEEQGLVYNTKNIEVPAGVQSIDVYGYVNNLTVDGEKSTGQEVNTGNYRTYLFGKIDSIWDANSRMMYESSGNDETDNIRIVPGLFSGIFKDYPDVSPYETRERGNDLIESVTMHTVKYLPDYAFDSCERLVWVNIGADLADIGRSPFRGCYSLIDVSNNDYYYTDNAIVYSHNDDGTLTIEECLAARGNLKGQAIINASTDPLKSVSSIREGAFEDCDYITEINFDNNDSANLKVIPEDCFRNADRLQTVVLPSTVNDVKQNAFVGANNLTGLTVYGREVQISARAFNTEKQTWTTVYAYADSAVVRYVGQYGDEYHLRYDDAHPLGEWWSVAFYDANYELIEELKDQDGEPLDNPQFVADGQRPTTPQSPANTDDWTFERWVGMNNVKLGDPIHENTAFYAQGYTTSGLVNGRYPVSFWDGVDGTQVGPMQYIDPGSDAIPPAHPVHDGYTADGFSDDYTNILSPKTIIMKYKPTGAGTGTGTGTGTGSGGSTQNSSNGSSNNNSSSNSSSGASTTSASSDSTSTLSGMYTVTVINGSGSGNYAPGATVLIQANTPAAGSVFSKWTTESQGVTLASVSTTPTTFTMPSNNVTITAEFTSAPVSGSNSNSGNTGNNGNGSTRVDITKPGISNKDLATATVNGSTDNFVVKITETDEATRAVAAALTNKYGSLDNILYYAMDISLYDSTGTVKITNTAGLTVDITIPIPDALVAYGGNNMAGAVINGDQLENLSESFTTINGVPCIKFTATHFSPYTIYVDTGNLTEGMLDVTPKTGDPIHPKWFLSLGLACLSVILFMKKDKAVKVKTA